MPFCPNTAEKFREQKQKSIDMLGGDFRGCVFGNAAAQGIRFHQRIGDAGLLQLIRAEDSGHAEEDRGCFRGLIDSQANR